MRATAAREIARHATAYNTLPKVRRFSVVGGIVGLLKAGIRLKNRSESKSGELKKTSPMRSMACPVFFANKKCDATAPISWQEE